MVPMFRAWRKVGSDTWEGHVAEPRDIGAQWGLIANYCNMILAINLEIIPETNVFCDLFDCQPNLCGFDFYFINILCIKLMLF